MPDTRVVRLVHLDRIAGRSGLALDGEAAYVFALLFLGVGAIGLVVSVEASLAFGFGWENIAFGLAAMSAGAFALAQALRTRRGRMRQERLRRERPDEPWMADHPWDRRGDRAHPGKEAARGAAGLLVLALFVAPFNVWAVRDRDGRAAAFALAGDLVLLGLTGRWLYGRARALKYGAPWIVFDEFPFFLGRTLRVHIGTSRPLGRFTKATAVVRFVREAYETDEEDHRRVVCCQHWSETQTLEREQVSPSGEVALVFALPEGNYETSLASRPPAYWEIELHIETPGVDLRSRFLVPVYGTAASAAH
jgi:hypothetical protein